MEPFATIDFDALPIGIIEYTEGAKIGKFSTREDAEWFYSTLPQDEPDGSTDGKVVPFVFVFGGMWIVVYKLLVIYYHFHPGGR